MAEQNKTDALVKVVEEQSKLLEQMRKELAEDEQEEITESKYLRMRRLALQAGTAAGAVAGAILGGVEAVGFMVELYETRAMAAEYATVAEEVYHVENNPEVAMNFMDMAIELDDSPEYRTNKAYYQSMQVVRELVNLDRPYNQDELDRAQESLAQAILLKNLNPEQAEPHILLGQLYIVLKQPDKALASLQEAVKIEPNNAFAHMRLATLLEQQNKDNEALAELDQALKIDPNYKWAYLWKGVVMGEKLEKWPEARALYQKSIDIDPRFDLAYYNLGWSYVNAEPADYVEARKQFEKAIEIRPSYKEAFYGLGMMYGYQNEYGVAENYLGKAVSIDEDYLTGWKWRGVVRAEQQNWEGALEDYSQAIALDPVNESLYLRRGFAYENLGQYNLAAADYRFSIQRNPNDPDAWLSQAGLSIKTKEFKSAAEQIAKAIELGAYEEDAVALRAKLHEQQGNIDEAIKDLSLAIKVATYRPERFLTSRADLYASKSQVDLALADYKKAREINENHAEAWLGEGNAYITLDDKSSAKLALTRYLELKPQDEKIRKLRDTL